MHFILRVLSSVLEIRHYRVATFFCSIIKIIVLCLPRYIYSLGCQVCFQKKTSIFIHTNLLTNFFDCRSFVDVILDIKRCRPGQSGSWYHHGSYYCHSHGIPQKFCAKGTMLGLFVVVHPYSLEV